MTAFEILYFNRELFNRVISLGLNLNDYKYIDMYLEYKKMINDGEKVSYTTYILSLKYGISERNIYNIIKRLQKDCNIGSV